MRPVRLPLPGQHLLGQRRAVVWHVLLVADQRQRDMKSTDYPMYYYPFLQDDNPGAYTYYVRAGGSANLLLPASVRREISRISPTIAVYHLRWMDSQIDVILSVERAISTMSAFFGALAAVLAAIGLYGVSAYNAGSRVTEIGVRIALGANRANVIGLVLRGALPLILLGLIVGLPLTVAAGRFLGSQLYGISPYNLAVMSIAVVTLGFSALIASLIPALRASSISPLEALRAE